jgi:hypothetical protein
MLTITVTNSRPMASDSFWPEIERAIGVLTGEADGKLTRIARPDGQCNYRDYGRYELTYTAKWSEHEIVLELR